MAVYVVTWNLNLERRDYAAARKAFLDHVERFSFTKDSNLETVRWIETAWTVSQVREYLFQKLDDNDRLFVSRVRRGESDGHLEQFVWDWINART